MHVQNIKINVSQSKIQDTESCILSRAIKSEYLRVEAQEATFLKSSSAD